MKGGIGGGIYKRGNGKGIWRVGVDFMKGGKFGKENSRFKGVKTQDKILTTQIFKEPALKM